VLEGTSHVCPHCQGAGRVRSVESAALALLRALDEAAAKQSGRVLEARAATEVALYLLNEKRDALAALEANRHVRVRVGAGEGLTAGDFEINVGADTFEEEPVEAEDARRARRGEAPEEPEAEAEIEEEEEEEVEVAAEGEAEERRGKRRRRGRRGGRRRREEDEATTEAGEEEAVAEAQPLRNGEERAERGRAGKRRRRGRGRGRRVYEVDGGEWLDFVSADLKHLTPRPERVRAAPAAEPEIPPPSAEVIAHPASEPAPEPVVELAAPAPAETPFEDEARITAAEAAEAISYEPDQERRDKFFSRLSRWAKKN
jgi:ribonuclease E